MIVRAIVAAALVAAAVAPVRASTVLELGPQQLYDGADRVVEATVSARTTTWNATHTGLETHVTLSVSATLKGGERTTIDIVVPGGVLGGGTHVIVGMPSVDVGERARWFLRDRGDGVLAVYGWAQGKWPERTIDGVTTFVRDPVAAEHDTRFAQFTTNGMVWPAAKMPVPYLIQNAGSLDITMAQELAAIDAAFATWQAVPCASLTFTNAGMTNLGAAVDGNNVLLFIESGWTFGTEAAAATSLWIIDGQQTADIAFNGQMFTWAIGPPGAGINSNILDVQGVLTHELGHFSGLGHTMRAYDTMYYSWKPWQGQRTLSIDDKLGLCSIYPIHGDECPMPACPAEETCVTHHDGMLCDGAPDPIGSPCNYDRIECDSFCLFTATNLSQGYCSKFCTKDSDCPPTHHCAAASAGGTPVKACFMGAQPPPDAGVAPCTADSSCPTGQHCDVANGACTFECRTSADCSGGTTCDDRGFCATGGGGGCGCRSSGGEPALFGLLGIWLFGQIMVRRKIASR
ncbi:MAG: hypothetical protein JWO36_2410 [Myxococcales bacterium]|nr:hypothetical protein [Myxococcales bacterium]